MSNVGIALIFLVLSWAVFGIAKIVDSCKGYEKPSKATGYIWYYLFTLHLLLLLQLTFFSAYSLAKYTLINNIDSINITLSLFLAFSSLFFIVTLWYLTNINKFEGSED